MIVATLVSVDDLDRSSSFGRVTAEQLASRFCQQGFAIKDVKLRKSLFVKEGAGEFMLSREVKGIAVSHDAQAVVVGTYGLGSDRAFISVRAVDPQEGLVVGSHDYALPLGPNLRSLFHLPGDIYYVLPGLPAFVGPKE